MEHQAPLSTTLSNVHLSQFTLVQSKFDTFFKIVLVVTTLGINANSAICNWLKKIRHGFNKKMCDTAFVYKFKPNISKMRAS